MQSFPRPRAAALLTALVLLAACRQRAPVAVTTAPEPQKPVIVPVSRWSGVAPAVIKLVDEDRYTAADALLQQFVREHGPTAESDRARWWRAMIRADQRAAAGDLSIAFSLMDSLLGATIAPEVRGEVTLVRRSLAAVDSLRRAEIRRRTQATQTAATRDDELKTARDSIGKLATEIERLRRRLSAP